MANRTEYMKYKCCNFHQLLQYAVQKNQVMLCRFILSHSECDTNFTLLHQLMKQSIEKGQYDCCKAISWFITKHFYRANEIVLGNIVDIWPGFKCICTKVSVTKKTICSPDVRIIVENETKNPALIENFHGVQIMQISYYGSEESSSIHDKIQAAEGVLHFPSKTCVDAKTAREIFDKHTKLTIVLSSPFKSVGFRQRDLEQWKIKEMKCLHLYCRVKGFIPVGEDHFPVHCNGLPTDVIEGSSQLCSNIKVGSQVG